MIGIKDHSSGLQIDFLCKSPEPLDVITKFNLRNVKDDLERCLDVDKVALLQEYLQKFDPKKERIEYKDDDESDIVNFFTRGFNNKYNKDSKLVYKLNSMYKDANGRTHINYGEGPDPEGTPPDVKQRLFYLLKLTFFLPIYTQGDPDIILYLIYLNLDNELIIWLMIYYNLHISLTKMEDMGQRNEIFSRYILLLLPGNPVKEISEMNTEDLVEKAIKIDVTIDPNFPYPGKKILKICFVDDKIKENFETGKEDVRMEEWLIDVPKSNSFK